MLCAISNIFEPEALSGFILTSFSNLSGGKVFFFQFVLKAQTCELNIVDPDQTPPFVASDLVYTVLQCPGPEVIKLFSCSTQLSMEFSPLINVKMPTIVGILTCMSRKNNILGLIEP